jgi:N-succinyldiaminopimelate aminotransferase
LYREKFEQVLRMLADSVRLPMPQGAFYLWLPTPIPDTEFARGLYAHYNVTVLPGSYLAREAHGVNPGKNFVRVALVPSLAECVEAAERLTAYLASLQPAKMSTAG